MNWDRQTSASDSFSKLVSGGLEASKRISKYGSSARGWIDWIGLLYGDVSDTLFHWCRFEPLWRDHPYPWRHWIGQSSARIFVWISDSGFEVAFWGRYLVPEWDVCLRRMRELSVCVFVLYFFLIGTSMLWSHCRGCWRLEAHGYLTRNFGFGRIELIDKYGVPSLFFCRVDVNISTLTTSIAQTRKPL